MAKVPPPKKKAPASKAPEPKLKAVAAAEKPAEPNFTERAEANEPEDKQVLFRTTATLAKEIKKNAVVQDTSIKDMMLEGYELYKQKHGL